MLCTKDFYKKPKYNSETQEQLWCSIIGDAHDSFCGCEKPFSHLLASIFPIGHADRNKSINQILQRDYKEQCLSGGAAAANSGMVATEDIKEDPDGQKEEEEDIEEKLDALLAEAAENAER